MENQRCRVTYFISGEAEKLFSFGKELDSYDTGRMTPQNTNWLRDDIGIPKANFIVDAGRC